MLDCTRRYSDPSSLRKHLKSLHGESSYTVFRELKSSVRVWEKSFRIRNDVQGVAHIVGVNGEVIDFDEIVKHIVDMTNVEVQHRPSKFFISWRKLINFQILENWKKVMRVLKRILIPLIILQIPGATVLLLFLHTSFVHRCHLSGCIRSLMLLLT